ncbi:hypothetical protein BKH43_05880 [Helicobacter sp. 13S00401-1]|uniref:hypothetical protein n=1 Tax=Helicobacter sp. 13S00401-1 TaxID=1905758 RepID=UPI000BA588CE|nr:hypothetical protein [Helicobacter sp. 13S00401-1]PAF50137.1 hypothetical protein BKH43_05880 [Helicobacter sp. 13S00401-1]
MEDLTLRFSFTVDVGFDKSFKILGSFIKILKNIAFEFKGVSFYFLYEDGMLYVVASGENKEVLDFANALSTRLPFCSSITFKEVVAFSLINTENYEKMELKERYHNVYDVLELTEILKSEDFKGLEKFVDIKEDSKSFEEIAAKLKNKESVYLKVNDLGYEISLSPISEFVMFADLRAASSYLRLDEKTKNALPSFERPFISVKVKEIFKEMFITDKQEFLFASLPKDIYLNCLLKFLESSEMDYVFIKSLDSKEAEDITFDLSYETLSFLEPHFNSFTLSNRNFMLSHKKLFVPRDINLLVKPKRALFQFDKKADTLFLIGADGEFHKEIDFSFSFSPLELLDSMRSKKVGAKIATKFFEENPTIESNPDMKTTITSTNLVDFFNVVSFLLGFEEHLSTNFTLMKLAHECIRDKGPKIDIKTKKTHECPNAIDYTRVLRGLMTFKVAGIDNSLLSHGMIYSICEFMGEQLAGLVKDDAIKEVFLCGDMLLEDTFLNGMLEQIPSNLKILLP